MTLLFTTNPVTVHEGDTATATLTVANDGDAVGLTGLLFAVETQLIDVASVSLGALLAGWTSSAPIVTNGLAEFRVNAPSGFVLLCDGALSFQLPISADAETGNITASAITATGLSEIGTQAVSVVTQVSFTSLTLLPAQVGPGEQTQLSWATVGASTCLLQWTPSQAVSVQCGDQRSIPGDSSMSVPASDQATIEATATAHLNLTALGSDGTERPEQLSLWMPDLAIQLEVPARTLDPGTSVLITYSAVDDPNEPTSVSVGWTGDQATVTQDGHAVPNPGPLASPSGAIEVQIGDSTMFTFTAQRADGVQSNLTTTLALGKVVAISLDHKGAFVANMRVTAEAEGRQWKYNTGNFSAPNTKKVMVPLDSTSIAVEIKAEKGLWDWKTVFHQTYTAIGANGLSFHTWGSAAKPHAGQGS